MPKLLSGFIAKKLGAKLGPQVKAATLVKTTEGAYTSGAQSGDTAKTLVPYAARGWVERLSDADIDGTLITRQDVKVVLLGATIAGKQVPANGDKVTIETATYTVIALLDRDPDGATYELAARL